MFSRIPEIRQFEIVSRLPDSLRKRASSEWAERNLGGAELDAFLEGPVFDSNGTLFMVDIPFGRILSLSSGGQWSVIAEYDGWPNGMKLLRSGNFLVADHKKGLLEIERNSGAVSVMAAGFEGEPFLGLNDLTVSSSSGDTYFTDQGLSGLQDPCGRVFKFTSDGNLRLLMSDIPSPNGLVLSRDEKTLFLAVTRANAICRLPLMADGSVCKAGTFIQMSGGVGPDGLARPDETDCLLVAHPGLGVWQFAENGMPQIFWQLEGNEYTTNLAANPLQASSFYVTESKEAAVLSFTADYHGRTR